MKAFCAGLFLMICAISVPHAQEHYVIVDQVPIGDAPMWVRESWVGIKLPYTQFGKCADYGVISHEQVTPSVGFYVPQDVAIEHLKAYAPRAAQWWIDNGFPHGKELFCFSLLKLS